jgi:hypothetical protein
MLQVFQTIYKTERYTKQDSYSCMHAPCRYLERRYGRFLQGKLRAYTHQTKFRRLRENARTIQRNIRAKYAHDMYATMRGSAAFLQTRMRASIHMHHARIAYITGRAAACLQARMRRRHQIRVYCRARASLRIISACRTLHTRLRTLRWRVSAIKIQAWFRGTRDRVMCTRVVKYADERYPSRNNVLRTSSSMDHNMGAAPAVAHSSSRHNTTAVARAVAPYSDIHTTVSRSQRHGDSALGVAAHARVHARGLRNGVPYTWLDFATSRSNECLRHLYSAHHGRERVSATTNASSSLPSGVTQHHAYNRTSASKSPANQAAIRAQWRAHCMNAVREAGKGIACVIKMQSLVRRWCARRLVQRRRALMLLQAAVKRCASRRVYVARIAATVLQAQVCSYAVHVFVV